MDSITQFVLGASIGLAVSPVKSRRIALVSGLVASLPDADILLDYGNDLVNTVKHRGFSHSLIFLSLLSFPLAGLIKKLCYKTQLNYLQWFWLCFLVLITHPLLDSFTIYGTQLFWPFPVENIMIGSMFAFDLFYTLPLLVSLIILLKQKNLPIIKGLSLNTWVLGASSAYLLLSLVLQAFVLQANSPLIPIEKIVNQYVMPTPSNLIVWQSVFIDKNNSYESFYNVITNKKTPWLVLPLNKDKLLPKDNEYIKQYDAFSHGFYQLIEQDNQLILRDIRMGTTEMTIFGWTIATKKDGKWQAITPTTKPLDYFKFKHMLGW